MPIIGAVTSGLDFLNYFSPLSDTATALNEAKNQGAVLARGNFVTVAINFLIIDWVLFRLVKGMNRLRRTEDAKTGTAEKPLTEIRDLMKTGRTL